MESFYALVLFNWLFLCANLEKSMTYKTQLNYAEERLPWEPLIPEGADKLILGTFPSESSKRKIDFYYPNPANRFWNVLSTLAESPLLYFSGPEAVSERKAILGKLKLGLSSMGMKILRIGKSSLDEHILALEYLNVFQLLDRHPGITRIILTSSSGKASTLAWFKAYCQMNDVNLVVPKGELPIYSSFDFGGRQVTLVIVNSTSGISSKSINYLTEQYRNVII